MADEEIIERLTESRGVGRWTVEMLLMFPLNRPEAAGEAFNIGNPRSTLTIYNLAREVVRLARSESRLELVPWPYADVELRIPDVTKARKLLNFEPKIDLDKNIPLQLLRVIAPDQAVEKLAPRIEGMFDLHDFRPRSLFVLSTTSFRRRPAIPSAGRTDLGQTSLQRKTVSQPQTPVGVSTLASAAYGRLSRGSLTKR